MKTQDNIGCVIKEENRRTWRKNFFVAR